MQEVYYLHKALDIYIKRRTQSSLGITYFQLGLLSNELLDFEQSKKYFEKAKIHSLNTLEKFTENQDDPFWYVILKDLNKLKH